MRAAVLSLALATVCAGPVAAQPADAADVYAARVRQSFAAAEALQGPLDGGWTLSTLDGAPLFALRFADREGRLEAVWRDLRRPGALDASGVVEAAVLTSDRLVLRFAPQAGVADTATLVAGGDGAWRGELDEGGRRSPVRLRKSGL